MKPPACAGVFMSTSRMEPDMSNPIMTAPIIADAALDAIVDSQYDVASFAEKHGFRHHQAREILSLAGTSRDKADALVLKTRK